MAQQVPARLTTRERRRFGFTVGVAFLLFAALSRWRGHDVAPLILGGIGGTLVLAGIVLPQALGPVYRWWMGLARVLSKVTTPLFMGLVYFLVLTPIGVIRRVFGSSPLEAKSRNGSYWAPHQSSSGHSMTRQF
ncbi:MAG: SxtJ family membrane protein [Gemmatimonadaceae bacterium]